MLRAAVARAPYPGARPDLRARSGHSHPLVFEKFSTICPFCQKRAGARATRLDSSCASARVGGPRVDADA